MAKTAQPASYSPIPIPVARYSLPTYRIVMPHHCVILIPSFGRHSSTVLRVFSLLLSLRRGHIMGMAAPIYHSAEMVRALPDDGNRYETVHGELLVAPAPRLWHQALVRRLLVALDAFLKKHHIGEVLISPADISWSEDTLVQPDLFVAAVAEVQTLDWGQVKTLLLSVEVLNPGTERFDRFTKRRLYQEVGVPLYWIVDPDNRSSKCGRLRASSPSSSANG